jgi:uncharacterized protein YyaL (SSP411 family)
MIENRLANETSPYLLQHASNPVAWQPWDADALAVAAAEDKPLLISIGYAACHWCHVMAHESFEDPQVAELVNRSFIPIKIDREERPDLDALYMSATQAATGHGGWPMTVFATPDGRPFFAGTYFPPADRGGQPGFPRVLLALEDAWATQRASVESQADELAAAVAKEARFVDALSPEAPPGDLDLDATLDALVHELAQRFDEQDGGFGGAPKFPRPSYVEALLVHHRRTGSLDSLEMATTTLDAMAAGGIYDHLAGGFARYSVDAQWRVPHFEKMLTDQALLARAYLHGAMATGRPDYVQVVTETLDWMLSALATEHGGLASSLDADADGVEGSHAVFTPAEVVAALEGVTDALSPAEAIAFYSVTSEGTFEHGTSVLARPRGDSLLRTPEQETTRVALLAARALRPQPTVDDKVLVEWNAMAASVFAEAAAVLGVERWGLAAARIITQLDLEFRSGGGRLLRAGRAGTVAHLAMLGDHAWLIEALTRLFELDGDEQWLARADQNAAAMLELFHDGPLPTSSAPEQGGGFFTTGHDAESLLVRAKDLFDGAMPSATSVAATALIRLGTLRGDHDLIAIADRTISRAAKIIADHPSAVPDLVLAFGWLRAGVEVAIPGQPDALLAAARKVFAPFTLVVHGDDPGCALLTDRQVGLAYVCRRGVCELPVADPDSVVAQLADALDP